MEKIHDQKLETKSTLPRTHIHIASDFFGLLHPQKCIIFQKLIFRSHLSFGVGSTRSFFNKKKNLARNLTQTCHFQLRLFGLCEDSFHFFLCLIIFQSCNSLGIYGTCFNTSWIHPRNLTWNLKIMVSKRTFLFQGLIFRFHVKFRGCSVFFRTFLAPF